MKIQILRRVGISLLVAIALSAVVFAAVRLLPGDPASVSQPPVQHYFEWLAGVIFADFGASHTGRPASEVLAATIPYSLALLAAAVIIATTLGLWIGKASARRQVTRAKHRTGWISLILTAVPEFIVGIVLLGIFAALVVPFLPAGPALETPWWETLLQWMLPLLTLVLVATPYMVRVTRSALVAALDSDAAEMARLRGVPENVVVSSHATPLTIGPIARGVAMQLTWLISGVVVVEYLFQYPGVGQALVNAVSTRDVQVVQAIVLVLILVCIIVHLLAQVVEILANPRLRSTT
ncbi:ABC transporter permease [Enteractinococcus helveticum]|uniref:ABC transmembrane type-1 domain-containing protein n=1 Tax=Enteractinococcus helveticum TaxID=1837282 RepID=A0A1B7M120_9MICC|nr:ABC transporter permease [Enteractinococcus helveticum]OAV62074.1 hypothetical protein A6F49_07160 [Enteractinococcus helveticum]